MTLITDLEIEKIETNLHRALFQAFSNAEHVDLEILYKKAYELLNEFNLILPSKIKKEVVENTVHRINGLGEIETLINDPEVTEIMVNGKDNIFIEKNGKLQNTNLHFP